MALGRCWWTKNKEKRKNGPRSGPFPAENLRKKDAREERSGVMDRRTSGAAISNISQYPPLRYQYPSIPIVLVPSPNSRCRPSGVTTIPASVSFHHSSVGILVFGACAALWRSGHLHLGHYPSYNILLFYHTSHRNDKPAQARMLFQIRGFL